MEITNDEILEEEYSDEDIFDVPEEELLAQSTYVERDGVYYQIPTVFKNDIEAVKIIKKNARLSCKFAKECDKEGHLSGIFAVLEAVLEGEDLEFIERWIKNNAG